MNAPIKKRRDSPDLLSTMLRDHFGLAKYATDDPKSWDPSVDEVCRAIMPRVQLGVSDLRNLVGLIASLDDSGKEQEAQVVLNDLLAMKDMPHVAIDDSARN